MLFIIVLQRANDSPGVGVSLRCLICGWFGGDTATNEMVQNAVELSLGIKF